jgi:lipid A 4'-phosphatase
MSEKRRTAERLLWRLLAISLVIALIPAFWPSVDLQVSAYFLQTALFRTHDWWWVRCINEYTPAAFRTLAVVCLFAWMGLALRARTKPMWTAWAARVAFVGLALWAGPGLLVSASKEVTLRARPAQVQEFGGPWIFTPALQRGGMCNDSNCAFPSGHTSDGVFLASLMLLFPHRRKTWACVGMVSGVVVGFARVSVGAHWLSDALWAFPITLLATAITYRVMWAWDIANLRSIHSSAPPAP